MKTLKQLITESVNEYLREIEEAGNENAVIEKMKSCEEAIAVRERKINKEGIEEAMHDMIDPKKIKELQKEVKVIEKTLKKYQKQLEKLKSKNKHVGVKDDEDSTEEPEEIIDEVSLGENDTEDEEGAKEMKAPEEEDDNVDPNRINKKPVIDKMKYDYSLNESFLYMQKLAGVITEGQYQARKK